MNGRVLTLDEAASFLKVSKSTLYKLLESGKLSARKLGRAWRFNRSELEAWLRNPSPAPQAILEPSVTTVAKSPARGVISDLLKEERTFRPSDEFVAQANISDPNIYDVAR